MPQISSHSGLRSVRGLFVPTERAHLADTVAGVGLFCLPALVICMPSGLLPYALLLLISTGLGFARLRYAAGEMGRPLQMLLGLSLLLIVTAVVWMAKFENGLVDVGNRSRFLMLPWVALWAYALRPHTLLLWRGALVGISGALLLAVVQTLAGLPRAEGWSNAIVFADMALVLLVLVLFCRPQNSWRLPLLALLAVGVIIVLSGSRGVWLGLVATVLTLFACMKWASIRTRGLIFATLAVMAALLVLTVPALMQQLRLDELHHDVQRMEAGDNDSSAGARVERLHVAWDTFLQHPVTGVGIGRFDDAMKQLPICQQEWRQRCHLGHAHNDLAEWAATQGVPGVLLLLAVYGVPLVMFSRLYRSSGRKSFRGPAAAGVMVVVVYVFCGLTQSMFAHQVTASFYIAIVGVLIGLALGERRDRRTEVAQRIPS